MPDNYFNIIFTGAIREGFDEATVKQKAQQIFKLEAAKTAVLFSGKPTVLKKNIDATAAQKYQKVLHGIGMQTRVQPFQAAPLSNASADAPIHRPEKKSDTIDSLPVSPNISEGESLRVLDNEEVVERLREQQALVSNKREQAVEVPRWDVGPVGEWLADNDTHSRIEPLAAIDTALTGVTLAPVASDLSNHEEGAARTEASVPQFLADIPIDSVTLSPVGDDLLASSEQHTHAEMLINIDYLAVEAAKGDLLSPEEKKPLTKKEINTDHIHLE